MAIFFQQGNSETVKDPPPHSVLLKKAAPVAAFTKEGKSFQNKHRNEIRSLVLSALTLQLYSYKCNYIKHVGYLEGLNLLRVGELQMSTNYSACFLIIEITSELAHTQSVWEFFLRVLLKDKEITVGCIRFVINMLLGWHWQLETPPRIVSGD